MGQSGAAQTPGPHEPAPSLPLDPDWPAGGVDARADRTGPGRRALGAVFVGGCLGTLARYEVTLASPAAPGGFPAALLLVNLSGSLLLGLLLTWLVRIRRPASALRPFAGTGVLGGWTTYSSMAVQSVVLAKGGDAVTAAAFLGATVVGGLAAAGAGMLLARALVDDRRPGSRSPEGRGQP